MAQRDSGYARIARDAYQTPPWVTDVLVNWLNDNDIWGVSRRVWEPACGEGRMVMALEARGHSVVASDIAPACEPSEVVDFLAARSIPDGVRGIITNPPYDRADAFVERALMLTAGDGVVAMLLPVAWDSAKTRRRFFADHPAFRCKLVLTSRIQWFDPPPAQPGQPKPAGPSENHAWFVWDWDWSWSGPPEIAWAGKP
jgi:hypothetical protein